jgi:histidine triad (HIT) family protein
LNFEDDCIFCRITSRRSPALIVYESTHFICFFPIKPDVYGHILIVSRNHYPDLEHSPPDIGSDLFATVRTLFDRCRKRIQATGFNLLAANGTSAGQSVDHLHFHFLPRLDNDGLDAWPVFPSISPNLTELFELLSGQDGDA